MTTGQNKYNTYSAITHVPHITHGGFQWKFWGDKDKCDSMVVGSFRRKGEFPVAFAVSIDFPKVEMPHILH